MDAERRPAPDDWWRTGVVYQVYPRSFADSDGDGIGDLEGIRAHLDHLRGPDGALGVDAVWLSPVYPSPGLDVGYDVADYCGIDPLLGDLEGFDRLVADCHDRGIRVILDMVLNHTSSAHAWFRSSRADRAGEHGDWYIWRDPAGVGAGGRPRPPNNWVSFFGGSAWTWDPGRGQFYLHTFLPEQPDVNWRNPDLRAAMMDVLRFWLDRGVDGFRFDVFNIYFKHPDLLPNPRRRSRFGARTSPYDLQEHRYDRNQPELLDVLAEIRSIVDERPGRMTVGELFAGTPEEAAMYATDRHLVFDFLFVETPWGAEAFRAAIARRLAAYGPYRWPTVVMANHDQSRPVSRYGPGGPAAGAGDAAGAAPVDADGRARVVAALELTLRGTPFLYYGEEIGLPDSDVPPDEIVDPPARRPALRDTWWNRDRARGPMPWDDTPGHGFTSAPRPWIRPAADAASRNVAAAAADGRSILAWYRRLLALRHVTPALHRGGLRLLEAGEPSVLAYERKTATDVAVVFLAFGDAAVSVAVPARGDDAAGSWRVGEGTHRRPGTTLAAGERIDLAPLEALILLGAPASGSAGRAGS